ncbi:MAG: HAMP domain-containing sensor histidine kinase [Solirubrobacterales bacterium]
MNRRRFSWGIREKLTLLFFGVTFIAVTANFLIVVPRLEAQLRGNQVKEMERTARQWVQAVQTYEQTVDSQLTSSQAAQTYVDAIAQSAGTRVAILKPSTGGNPLTPQMQVLADTLEVSGPNDLVSDWIAARATVTGKPTSGTLEVFGRLHAEAAAPITANGRTIGAAVFSTSLGNVNAIVGQQARRNLIAGIFALGISLVVGMVASGFIARRIKRLEFAARSVADGNFTEPITIDSNDEIGELARAFNNMQDRLGRADRARKAFIANASHELRTPLFSLGGYVELMLEEDLDDQTQREFLETMHTQIHRLTKLATDLLDLSKIDTGSLAVRAEHVNVGELAHGVAREFEPQAAQHESEISVSTDDGVEAICDPDRLAQIVRILIDNALSHTPAGANIKIGAGRENGAVRVTVSDDGPGIPAEDLPRIFDRFYTGDKTGGTGLGLSIANEIATAMNSRLSVRSRPSETSFILTLPASGGGR